MTVNANDRRKKWAGNGVATEFNGPMAFDPATLDVYFIPESTGVAVLQSPSTYTVSRLGKTQGTRVLFTVAPPADVDVLILRTLPLSQSTDITNQSAFNANVLENGLDKLEMQIQQIDDAQARSLRLPDTSDGINNEIPTPVPGYLFSWDMAGENVEYVPPLLSLINTVSGATFSTAVSEGQTDVGMPVFSALFVVSDVYYNGVRQNSSAYTRAGIILTFSEPFPADGVLDVRYVAIFPGQEGDAGQLTYTAAGTGAVARSISDKLDDIVSVSDFNTVQAAVARAFAIGADLYWPDGEYAVTGNIPNFHSVRHFGGGYINRGGTIYRPDPQRGQTNTLFVDPAGSDTNDGLTAALPLATIQAAFDAVSRLHYGVAGNWVIQLAAGTYTNGALMSFMRPRHFRLRIIGPTVALNVTPTAIIDGAAATTADGLFFEGCGDIGVENIKMQNFTSNSVAAGVEAANTGLLRLVNVHVDACSVGYYIRSNCTYFVQGGYITNCTTGVQELFGVIRNFLTVSNLTDGTHISGCTYGIFAKEHCTGHLDWATIDNCTYGIFFSRSCTANASDGQITNCDYGVVLRHGSFVVPLRIDFGIGTGNANTVNYLPDHSSGFTTNENDVQAQFSAQGERMVAYSAGVAAHTGTTAETRLANFGKIIGGAFDYPGRYARLVIVGFKTGSAGTASLIMDVGNSNGATAVLPAAAGTFRVELWLISNGPSAQKVVAIADGAGSSNAAARGTRTYAMTANTAIGLDCILADAADSITIDAAWLYTTGPLLSDGL